jgi:hypothetical protein
MAVKEPLVQIQRHHDHIDWFLTETGRGRCPIGTHDHIMLDRVKIC